MLKIHQNQSVYTSPVKLTTLGRSYSKDEKSPTQGKSSQDLLESWETLFLTEKL